MATIDLGGNDILISSITQGYTRNNQTAPGKTQSAGSTYTAKTADTNKLILLDNTTSSTVTLPASSGSGQRFRFLVTAVPSGSHVIQVANSTDVMKGFVIFADTDGTAAVNGFMTTSTSDTVTLNHGTTGGVTIGEQVEVEDYATGFWRVLGFLSNTGTPTTPFSASVS